MLRREPPDHSGELPDLDVLEAQLAREAIGFGLVVARNELSSLRLRQDVLFLEGHVAAQLVVEGLNRLASGVLRSRLRRPEEAAEQLIQRAVLPDHNVGMVGHDFDSDTRLEKAHNRTVRMRGPRRLFVLSVLAAMACACSPPADPIRATLDAMAKAAHDRDAGAVMDSVASDFQASDGSSRADAEALLKRYFSAYSNLDVALQNVQIERAENTARVRLRAAMSGQPLKIGGLSGLLPSSASYDFDFRMTRDGKKWKVAWASWQRAGD